mmetsp:Transcript_2950/g.8228  ORF Transcript_2950/g.8228 Transcript_2950/m.8228 type:complete len:218 (-) Transcript_2950:4501-5154(-)
MCRRERPAVRLVDSSFEPRRVVNHELRDLPKRPRAVGHEERLLRVGGGHVHLDASLISDLLGRRELRPAERPPLGLLAEVADPLVQLREQGHLRTIEQRVQLHGRERDLDVAEPVRVRLHRVVQVHEELRGADEEEVARAQVGVQEYDRRVGDLLLELRWLAAGEPWVAAHLELLLVRARATARLTPFEPHLASVVLPRAAELARQRAQPLCVPDHL